MDETADARILTGVHQSDWSRPVGRPYTSWMATLKSDLSLHNLTLEDAIELALEKSLWRLLVASGATHWHGACRIMMMNDELFYKWYWDKRQACISMSFLVWRRRVIHRRNAPEIADVILKLPYRLVEQKWSKPRTRLHHDNSCEHPSRYECSQLLTSRYRHIVRYPTRFVLFLAHTEFQLPHPHS